MATRFIRVTFLRQFERVNAADHEDNRSAPQSLAAPHSIVT
jgi:hypothetical protein